jgi:hypothetical protein
MQLLKHFRYAKKQVLEQQFDSMAEQAILKHWRVHEPKKVEALLSKGILRRTLALMANALWDMQMDLEKSEKLHPVLAKTEAWRCLMRIEEDAKEEAEAWGMILEEYRNRKATTTYGP